MQNCFVCTSQLNMYIFLFLCSKLDDETLQHLKNVFLHTGRGRKRSLPKLPPTRKTFLQLHHLKTTHQKSWNDVNKWMAVLFPKYPSTKCRHLIEQTVKAASSNQTAADFEVFLQEEVDLDFIGKFLLISNLCI